MVRINALRVITCVQNLHFGRKADVVKTLVDKAAWPLRLAVSGELRHSAWQPQVVLRVYAAQILLDECCHAISRKDAGVNFVEASLAGAEARDGADLP